MNKHYIHNKKEKVRTMERFIELFAEAIEIDKSEVSPDSILESFATFDSLGVVTLIAMINEEYGKAIKAEDIRNAKTVQDLVKLIEN